MTSRGPDARSTTSDRAITIAHPPLNPCTSRASIITAMLGLNAQSAEASIMMTSAASKGRRRPRWSETAPR